MKKQIIILLVALAAFTSMAFVIKSSNGIAGQTGAPGEGTCNACHAGGASAATSISIAATPAFVNNEYVQGETYTLNITTSASGFNSFGFGCEILNSNNTNAGTMQNAGTGVKFLNAFNGRRNAVQTTPKAGSGSATFIFEWVAPTTGDDVKIFVGANGVNLNGTTTGDFPFSTSLTLTTPTVIGVKENVNEISRFSFYPNPATDKIQVSYNLKNTAKVNLAIVAINGQQLASMLEETQVAGTYKKAVVLPSELPSGVYFLRVSLNNQLATQKLITIH